MFFYLAGAGYDKQPARKAFALWKFPRIYSININSFLIEILMTHQ